MSADPERVRAFMAARGRPISFALTGAHTTPHMQHQGPGGALRAQVAEHLQMLRDHYEPSHDLGHDQVLPGERFVAAMQHHCDHDDHLLVGAPTVDAALQSIAENALDGWDPDGIYDLHNGDLIEVTIDTPIVGVAAKQGVMVNPLRPRSR
jgi:hypothetical protein